MAREILFSLRLFPSDLALIKELSKRTGLKASVVARYLIRWGHSSIPPKLTDSQITSAILVTDAHAEWGQIQATKNK